MNTIKLAYQTTKINKDIILSFIKNQNNVIKFLYNRLLNNKDLTQKELTILSNSMNNVFIDSWLKQSALYKAKELIVKNDKMIFGGRKLFIDRCKNKITKEEFQLKKLMPLISIGNKVRQGNNKFSFKIIDSNKLVFKPKCSIKIDILLPKLRKNYKTILCKIEELAHDEMLPVMIELDLNFIYITYDESYLKEKEFAKIKNRIMSLDLNPNYIGYSIIDWVTEDNKSILKTGCISIKEINDKQFALKKFKVSSNDSRMKYLVNKRSFEIFEISKYLINIAKNYNVESFSIEDLNIESFDKQKSASYNRLVNNLWNRNRLVSNLEKRLNIYGIKIYKILPQYSSFIGNILNREFFDPVAASIEINRRTYKFSNHLKPVLFPDFKQSTKVIAKSLEEFGNGLINLVDIESWKDLYKRVKNSKLRYRVPLRDNLRVFRLFDKKSLVYQL